MPTPAPHVRRLFAALACATALAMTLPAAAQQSASPQPGVEILDDNAASIAVVVGNKEYRQTVPVDFAHNDADAMRDYLVDTLGFRPENVFVLKDGTLSEMTQMFGSEARPQSGKLWRSVQAGASNVFVYYSGHGVPDLASGEPFLLPADGDPNLADSGYRLDTLYRNLELVKHKIGEDREVIVMVDACFTGETGRGESLLAVSAPGFTPALPQTGDGVVRLVATSGASPANWDEEAQLGLFTSRFLMGAAGLADDDGPVDWDRLSDWLVDSVSTEALRETGRRQIPEIDVATLSLPRGAAVAAVSSAVSKARDEVAWNAALDDRAALERYIAECDECGHRDEALARLATMNQGAAADRDRALWEELSVAQDWQGYLDQCGATCAYRAVALSYLGANDPSQDPRVARCDDLAASPGDGDRPDSVTGVPWSGIDGHGALAACTEAAQAFPDVRRLQYQAGRALDRLGRYGEAMEAYTKAADAGSMAALNNIATLHENGEGVPPSPETAFPIYVEAAEGGDTMAMTNAARMLEYGRGTAQDTGAAVGWYQKAADAGDGFAITKLVSYYIDGGPGITPDIDKAMDLYRQAIDLKEPLALAAVAVLIDNGFGSYFPDRTAQGIVLDALGQGEQGVAAIVGTTAGEQQLSPDTIRAVQRELSDFYTGPDDGTFNPLFLRAMDNYARSAASQRNE